MLDKARKITRNQFKLLNKPFKTIRGGFLLARIFKIKEEKESKFSFSISKKVEKSAVLRNKIRRISYLAIQKSLKNIKRGLAIHFILNVKPKDLKDDINNDISNLISQI